MASITGFLSDELEDRLYDKDIKIVCTERNGNTICTEIEFYSDYDGDQIEDIYYDDTNCDKSFIESLRKRGEEFDIDEYVEMWVDGRGKNGVPGTVRELLEDAESVKRILLDAADYLELPFV